MTETPFPKKEWGFVFGAGSLKDSYVENRNRDRLHFLNRDSERIPPWLAAGLASELSKNKYFLAGKIRRITVREASTETS
jgi:hypothetical protein